MNRYMLMANRDDDSTAISIMFPEEIIKELKEMAIHTNSTVNEAIVNCIDYTIKHLKFE